jgi:hypothetical protein
VGYPRSSRLERRRKRQRKRKREREREKESERKKKTVSVGATFFMRPLNNGVSAPSLSYRVERGGGESVV